MSKYVVNDIIDVLVVTFGFRRDEVYEPLDQDLKHLYYIEWDQGKDPTGSVTEVPEDTTIKIVQDYLAKKGKTQTKEYLKVSLDAAHKSSMGGIPLDSIKLAIQQLDISFNFGTILNNAQKVIDAIEEAYKDGGTIDSVSKLPHEYRVALEKLAKLRRTKNAGSDYDDYGRLYNQAVYLLPELNYILDRYQSLKYSETKSAIKRYEGDPQKAFVDSFMSVFSHEPLTMASQFKYGTDKLVKKAFDTEFQRPNNEPKSVQPWEMRIGGSKFFVPPIDVKVSQFFKTGSLSGGGIRQATSPKYNSGHSETAIQVTLYFPGLESIWGIITTDENPSTTFNFDDIKETSDAKIDYFISSLRGLIAQFKYAPFLPVKNQYLNQAWNITGVTLNSMTVSTVENFPFCVAVTLNMMKFNHKVFLPMIDDFNQAVHWGRFRQYIGRAARAMQNAYNIGFLINDPKKPSSETTDKAKPSWQLEQAYKQPFTRPTSKTWADDTTRIKFYYPSKTTTEIFAPDDSMFRQPREDENVGSAAYERDKAIWEKLLGTLGVDVDQYPNSIYDTVINYSKKNLSSYDEWTFILEYLKYAKITSEEMTNSKLQEFLNTAIKEEKAKGKLRTPEEELAYRKKSTDLWFSAMFEGFANTPFYKKYVESYNYKNGSFTLNEWEVPMDELKFDNKSIFIQGISVSLSNNFAKHQIQLHDEPTYQHVGGGDCRLDISMVVLGEDNLIRIRRMFDRIGGLARLEHSYGVLGFLGVKNELTALAGIKYILPVSYEVDTVPGFPRVYNVRLSFVDFDVFQQKREKLSSEQQNELVQLFGKRNPFLRVKQAWGRFSAYPDFPLTIIDKETGYTVGTIDPDFYFRSFTTIDDDLTYWGSMPQNESTKGMKIDPDGQFTQEQVDQINKEVHPKENISPFGNIDVKTEYYSNKKKSTIPYKLEVTHHILSTGEKQDKSAVVVITEGGKVKVGTQEYGKSAVYSNTKEGGVYIEGTSVPSTMTPHIPGLTPGARYQNPYAYNSLNPAGQYELIMNDAKYRDINGRMIKAFPTYMLWLIDEGGRFGGVKLFDNFYGLQSVVDFSVNRSEDVLGDTLVLRLSNLYSKLSTPFKGFVTKEDGTENIVLPDESVGATAGSPEGMVNQLIQTYQNIQSGMRDDYVVELDSIRLKPGVRVHLRMGYGSNPNSLDTVFNGVITSVQAGDIVEIIAQSDAIELSQYINTTNKKGDSGKIDGSIGTGFWLSEPRDLMVRLLSMGSSRFKEAFAHATRGQVFSESRFGIRHFGSILYEPLNDLERQKHALRAKAIENKLQSVAGNNDLVDALSPVANVSTSDTQSATGGENSYSSLLGGGFSGFLGGASVRLPLLGLMQSMWTNFFTKRDFELYKRNIYPGNGTGVAQYLGGDVLDAGPVLLEAAKVKGPDLYNYINNNSSSDIYNTVRKDRPRALQDGTEAWQDTILNLALSGARAKDPSSPTNDSSPDPDAAVNISQKEKEDKISLNSGVKNLLDGLDPTLTPNLYSTSNIVETGLNVANAVFKNNGSYANNPILQALGLVQAGGKDDDLSGFDEVSFRAQTYMKTVWDMFKLCASLLPNYIVAVRPFEDRSTVFYGKPHWLYTSGVIPLSTGVPKNDDKLKFEGPDDAFNKLLREASNKANPLVDYEDQQKFMQDVNTANPFTTKAGTGLEAQKPQSAESVRALERKQDGAMIPHASGKTTIAKHRSEKPVLVVRTKEELKDYAIEKIQGWINNRPILPERNTLGSGSTIDDGIDYEANIRSNQERKEWVELVKLLSDASRWQNSDKVNTILNDPSFIAADEKYARKNINELHREIDIIPDKHKFANFNDFRNLDYLPSPEDEQWFVQMRWPYLDWQQVLGQNWDGAENKVPGYDNIANYRNKRIAVSNPKNNKVVICSIVEDGPDDISFVAAVSPDVYYVLELDKSDTGECNFGFVDPKTMLGPTEGVYNQVTQTSLNPNVQTPTPVVTPGFSQTSGALRDYTAYVQPFQGTERMVEQLYPDPNGYPKIEQRVEAYKRIYESNFFITSFLYGWMQGDTGGTYGKNEDIDYKQRGPRQSGVYQDGHWWNEPDAGSSKDARYVEQYISGITNDIKPGYRGDYPGRYDIVGELARRIYDDDYNKRRASVELDPEFRDYYLGLYQTEDNIKAEAEKTKKAFENLRKTFGSNFGGIKESEAESVWDQFRSRWHIRTDGEFKEVAEIAIKFLINKKHFNPNSIPTDINEIPVENRGWYDGADSDINPDVDQYPIDRILFSTNMTKIVNNFKMLLWRLPFGRAWLAITTSRDTGSTANTIIGEAAGQTGGDPIQGYLTEQTLKRAQRGEFDFEHSEVTKLWAWYLGVNEDGSPSNSEEFSPNPDELLDAAAIKNIDNFLGLGSPKSINETTFSDIYVHPNLVKNFIAAMKRYSKAGDKSSSDLEKAMTNIKNVWDQTVRAFFFLVSSALTGVVGMFRMSLMEMGYGMGMLGAMQQQANILNKAFNDSIYYSLGEPGSAIWLADNPFTREYGEPVIEVREPFQRFHYLNSFQDIIDNGIQEKLDNVPTVITASSDGKYPVTVYFDKGASPEKQFEVGVQTGLFWDNARGSGFFGFLHPLLHPFETLRGVTKSATGSSDEILSRRVGLWNLKEGLKDIYGGELLVIGRADIRPHDLVYLADTYEKMYGIFEVEAVTHHMTSDTGFVTAITPNAMVTINDPARWTFQSWIWSMFGVQDTRNHVRHLLKVTADKTSQVYNSQLSFIDSKGQVNMTLLAESIQDSIRGNVQFTGGNSALLKDMATHAATGYMRPGGSSFSPSMDATEEIMANVSSIFNNPLTIGISNIPIIGSGLVDIAWDGWTWVRDNLLDQHGCYIQYLTKNGQPMDAGLSFNQGVAVGTHHTVNVLPGILGVEVSTTENGHRRITANDLMAQLGWQEIEISSIQKQASWWNNFWNAKVLELAGHGPDPITISPPNAFLARIIGIGIQLPDKAKGVIDGDTIKVQKLDKDGKAGGEIIDIRLTGVNAAELEYKQNLEANEPYDKAYLARKYLEKILILDPQASGFEPIVAIRESIGAGQEGNFSSKDKYGRTLAVVFHRVASEVKTSQERATKLLETATEWPLVSWDSFTPNGAPYTANWEMIISGFAYTDMGGVRTNDPDRGYASGRYTGNANG